MNAANCIVLTLMQYVHGLHNTCPTESPRFVKKGYVILLWEYYLSPGLDPFILFLIFKFKFKFIDFKKTKFIFTDFEKTKFKFTDFEKTKFKFIFKFIIDFAKVDFKWIFAVIGLMKILSSNLMVSISKFIKFDNSKLPHIWQTRLLRN